MLNSNFNNDSEKAREPFKSKDTQAKNSSDRPLCVDICSSGSLISLFFCSVLYSTCQVCLRLFSNNTAESWEAQHFGINDTWHYREWRTFSVKIRLEMSLCFFLQLTVTLCAARMSLMSGTVLTFISGCNLTTHQIKILQSRAQDFTALQVMTLWLICNHFWQNVNFLLDYILIPIIFVHF